MSAKYSGLTLDRNLLDHNFDGYKLSLNPLQSAKCELVVPVERKLLDPNQYSLLHAKIFVLHNFLSGETTASHENVYFVDQKNQVQRANYNVHSNEIEVFTVWEIPRGDRETIPKNGSYFVSLKLISMNLAVLSDGDRSLYIVNTGERSNDCKWQLVFSEDLTQFQNFYIQDAVLNGAELHLILCRIEYCDSITHLAVYWITYLNELDTWKIVSTRELSVKGDVSYLYLERTCEAIYVASSSGCKFIFDSKEEIKDKISSENHGNIEKPYKWSQDSESIVLHFLIGEDIIKENLSVSCGCENIKVEYKETCLLSGTLFREVESDLITISQSKNLLEIILIKKEQDITWVSLMKESSENFSTSDESYMGEEIMSKLDHLTSSKEENPPQGITFNTEEVEDCDFSNSELTIFERLCVRSHEVTHVYTLGSNQILLTVQNEGTPIIGTRHDVDVCLWEPTIQDNNFSIQHVATLLAFGYIQASKQQKKFLACPPDFSYSLICDSSRHLFLYRQKSTVNSGVLRNRKSGSKIDTVAEQKVISIPNEEVLGIYASNTAIYVLGQFYLMYIKI